jgi:hypothetical protein
MLTKEWTAGIELGMILEAVLLGWYRACEA